jgi:hypothetical protein
MAYKTPIQTSVRPDTNPLAAAVRRDEQLLATEPEADIGVFSLKAIEGRPSIRSNVANVRSPAREFG